MDLIEDKSNDLYYITQLEKEKTPEDVATKLLLLKDVEDFYITCAVGVRHYYTLSFNYDFRDQFYIALATTVPVVLYWILSILPGGDRSRTLTIPVVLPITLRTTIYVFDIVSFFMFGVKVISNEFIDFVLEICRILIPFSFVVNSFFLLLAQSFVVRNRKMDMSSVSIFFILLGNVVLVVLVVLLYNFLFHDASVFYSIIVMIGHGVMIVAPSLCLCTIVAAPLMCCVNPHSPDSPSHAVYNAKIRLFWGSAFVLIASIPLLLSILFSALRIEESLKYNTVLFDYKYVGWYSNLTDRSNVHYSSVAVQYMQASNLMPFLHDIFPLWYLLCAILLLTPFRRRLFCCESDKKTTKKISAPPADYPTKTVQQNDLPTLHNPTVTVHKTVQPTREQHPSTIFPEPSTVHKQHPSTLFPEPTSATVITPPTAPPVLPAHNNPHGTQLTTFYHTASHAIPVSNMYPSLTEHTLLPTVSQPISLYPAIPPVMVFQAPPSPLLNHGYHVHNYPHNNQRQTFFGNLINSNGIQPGIGY